MEEEAYGTKHSLVHNKYASLEHQVKQSGVQSVPELPKIQLSSCLKVDKHTFAPLLKRHESDPDLRIINDIKQSARNLRTYGKTIDIGIKLDGIVNEL